MRAGDNVSFTAMGGGGGGGQSGHNGTVSIFRPLEESKRKPKRGLEPMSSAHKPEALPLAQTGSFMFWNENKNYFIMYLLCIA